MTNPLSRFEDEVKARLGDALQKLGLGLDIVLDEPPEGSGEFAFACFPLAKLLGKAPNDCAEQLAAVLETSELIAKFEQIGPYVNFFVDQAELNRLTLNSILDERESYGHSAPKGLKMILEHTSANPTGPLHIGRARNPLIGDTLTRILRAHGYEVRSEYWVNDMGKQAAILTYGVLNVRLPKSESERDKPDHELVRYYQEANASMEQDASVAEAINELLRKNEQRDAGVSKHVKATCKKVLDGIIESLQRLNIQLDNFVYESAVVEDGSVYRVIDTLKATRYSREDEGAFYLDMSEFGIPGRSKRFYFTRNDGTSLYTTRDLAYHMDKLSNCDMAVNVLGEDHKLEARQLAIALELLGLDKVPEVVFYSFVSLPEGKMSTRRGRVVYLDDLVDEAVERAYDEVKKRRGTELDEAGMRTIAEIVGIGAIRYNIIKVQPEKSIVFRWDEALSFEGNAAPFIQYAHARACSILRKGNSYEVKGFDPRLIEHANELKLVKWLAKFPNVIAESAEHRKPYMIANYVYNLAYLFNQFYRDCPVLSAEPKLRNARLALVECARFVLANGLDLLGIEAPSEM